MSEKKIMTAYHMECLQSFAEFQSVQSDWQEFTQRFFPENYSRTHAWLSAWWTTYHYNQPALVYIQRRPADGRIVAVAPLFIKKEVFSGLPILSLQTLGVGIGADDFLISPEAQGFAMSVFSDLANNRRWHVARFRRLRSTLFCEETRQTCATLACITDYTETEDYVVEFPASYTEYLQSRTRKFRRNLNQAANRLDKEGTVTVDILDPILNADRVWTLGKEVAATSWQFREGKSHFNDSGSDCFYANLAKFGRGSGGEEFTVMLVDGRPVAFLLGCRRGRTYFAVDTAFHADYRHVSVGRLLFGRIIERLIEQGEVAEFDFEGDGEYKDDYATNARKAHFLTIYNRSLYSRGIRLLRGSRFYATLKGFRNRSYQEKVEKV